MTRYKHLTQTNTNMHVYISLLSFMFNPFLKTNLDFPYTYLLQNTFICNQFEVKNKIKHFHKIFDTWTISNENKTNIRKQIKSNKQTNKQIKLGLPPKKRFSLLTSLVARLTVTPYRISLMLTYLCVSYLIVTSSLL